MGNSQFTVGFGEFWTLFSGRFFSSYSAIGAWYHEFKEGFNWTDIEGNVNYGLCDESAVAGAASVLSLKKKREKLCCGIIKGSWVIWIISISLSSPTTTWNRVKFCDQVISARGIRESPFPIVSDCLGLRCPPFACLAAIRSLVSFVPNTCFILRKCRTVER